MPIIPVHADTLATDIQQQALEKRRAIKALQALAAEQMRPSRHIVFVPGWAGERGECWLGYGQQLPGRESPRVWLERIMPEGLRQRYVHFIQFSEQESASCASFLDFAPLLKAKIRSVVPADEPMDLAGHSMGSLDAMAAISQDLQPLRRVVNLVAAGSPLQGIIYGQFVEMVDPIIPTHTWRPHHYRQVRNLNTDSIGIQWMNALGTRQRLLERISALWTIAGTQDMVVMRSAQFLATGLTAHERAKVTHREIGGAVHTDPGGVTHDPRTVLAICNVMQRPG